MHSDEEVKEMARNIKKLRGQEVEFKEILSAKKAAESIKEWVEN